MRSPIRYAAASAAAVIVASTGLAGLAGPAHAAQSTQTLSCGGQEPTVRGAGPASAEDYGTDATEVLAPAAVGLVSADPSVRLRIRTMSRQDLGFRAQRSAAAATARANAS